MNKLEEEPEIKAKPARGMEIYDKDFFKLSRNSKSVDTFFEVADEIDELVRKREWNLEKKFNKYYMGFKFGFPNVCGIHWIGTKSFELFFKVNPDEYKQIQHLSPYEMEYDERWKRRLLDTMRQLT
ncbi:MAG TPA: hypothetical protein VHT73_10755 [Thermodesulfobacteriota bacterium]|nr:hypothetical protein [Thermodesulfobacteriota bacterium]